MTALPLLRTRAKARQSGGDTSARASGHAAGRATSHGSLQHSAFSLLAVRLSGTALQRIDLAATEHGERAPGGSPPFSPWLGSSPRPWRTCLVEPRALARSRGCCSYGHGTSGSPRAWSAAITRLSPVWGSRLWGSKTGHRLLTCAYSCRDGRWAGRIAGP